MLNIIICRVVKILTTNYYSYWRHIETLFKLTNDYQIMMKTIKVIQGNSIDVCKFVKLM